jgi:hypothetical protein
MPQAAIIHTATRVIRRLTTDASPSIASDETAVVLSAPIDLAGGFWKLDGANAKVAATAAEAQASGVDEAFVNATRAAKIAALTTALQAAVDDALIAGKLKTLLQKWLDVLKM